MLIEIGSHIYRDGVARKDDGLAIDGIDALDIPRKGGIANTQYRCHMLGHVGFVNGDHAYGGVVPALAQLGDDIVLVGQAQCRGNRAHVGATTAPAAAVNEAFYLQYV